MGYLLVCYDICSKFKHLAAFMLSFTHMRKLIIGDVHGCLRELQLLLEKVNYQEGQDRLIFLGDLINKGPDSLGVLNYVRSLKSTTVLLGNHELALLAKIERGESVPIPREMIAWIKTWPYYIDEDDVLLVHGGVVPGVHPRESNPFDVVRIRLWQNKPWYEFYHEKKLVVFGHWAARGLVWRDNAIGLDTGCVYGRKLSCLELPGRKLIQVDALNAYAAVEIKDES